MPTPFTSLITYCANMAAPGKVRSTMGLYVASTIIGGFPSRVQNTLIVFTVIIAT